MRLTYRGVPYDAEPASVDMAETRLVGRYRGQQFHFSYPRHIPVPQPTVNLQYRGLTYHKTATGQVEPLAPAAKPTPAAEPSLARNSVAEPAVAASSQRLPSPYIARQAVMRELSKVHNQNIERLLQHRLEVARAKGDNRLVAQLEKEMHQLA